MKRLRQYYGDEALRVRLLYEEFANKVLVQVVRGRVTIVSDLGNLLGVYFEEYTIDWAK